MADTERYYVTKKNEIKPVTRNIREYFGHGDFARDTKYIIEVFGYNHLKTAQKIRDLITNNNMENDFSLIKVEEK